MKVFCAGRYNISIERRVNMTASEFLSIIKWPVVVLLISVVIIFVFKKSINQLFNRLQKTKLPGGAEAEFASGETSLDEVNPKFLNEVKVSITGSSTSLPSVPNIKVVDQVEQSGKEDIKTLDWFYYFDQKDYGKARELLLDEISRENNKERVETLKYFEARMLSYYDFQGAIMEFEKLITENPSNYAGYFHYSWIYTEKNLPNEAISILDRGISRLKDADELIFRKAQILEQSQKYDEAITLADQKILLEGKHGARFYCLIARIHKTRNQVVEARSAYLKGFRKNPADLETIHEIAQYFYFMNEYQSELFFRKQAVMQNDKSSNDWALLGNCYLNLSLNNLAMDAYDEANKLEKENKAWIISNIGNLYNNLGLFSKGIVELSKSLEIDSTSQYAHERLSQAMENKNKEDIKSKEIFESSRKIVDFQAEIEHTK
jgi:tetratricopeptide (TPR) repeat protein